MISEFFIFLIQEDHQGYLLGISDCIWQSNNMTISESRNRNKQRCAKVQRCSLSWAIRRKSLDNSNIDHQLVNESGSKDQKLVLIFLLSPTSLSQHQGNCFPLLVVKCSVFCLCFLPEAFLLVWKLIWLHIFKENEKMRVAEVMTLSLRIPCLPWNGMGKDKC